MSKKIAIIHPDLGIGGAERLILDAALSLKQNGHKVTIFTTYHDKKRCFKETRDGTLNVKVYGQCLPRSFCGLFHIIFAIIRMCYCCIRIRFSSEKYDLFLVDQVSACIPFLKFCGSTKVLFYCHFPDMLLAKNRRKFLKRLYRCPFDRIEECTTGKSDKILVNSNFTKQTFKKYFKSLRKRDPEILYPTVDVDGLNKVPEDLHKYRDLMNFFKDKMVLVSINRFEKKKNIKLAVKSFFKMKSVVGEDAFEQCGLILAGGFDERIKENRECVEELESLTKDYKLEKQVLFLKSFSNTEKYILLHYSQAVLYTPEFEHFGIVPIEAQCCECPVIACNNGGPLESVEHGKTGFLCENDEQKWGEQIAKLISKNSMRQEFGKNGKERVKKMFTFEVFSKKLNGIVLDMLKKKRKKD